MASDNFNRANASPLDGNWATPTAFNALRLVGNAVENVTASTDSAAMHTVSTATSSYVTVSDVTGGRNGGPAIHLDNSGGGYCLLNWDAGNFYIYQLPSFTQIGFGTGTYQVGDVLGLRRVGSTIVASVNGTDVLTSSVDNTYTGGAPGIFLYNGGFVLDDWTDGAAGGFTLTADQGSYALNGQNATLTYTPVGSYSLTADQGSFAITGQAANTLKGFKVVADQGGYTVTGSDALGDYVVSAEFGVYNLNGQDANLVGTGSFSLAADFGTYNLSGQNAGLLYSRVFTAEGGSYLITGQAANILYNRLVSAGKGDYALNGQDASFIRTFPNVYLLSAEQGSYTFTGRIAHLLGPGDAPTLGPGDMYVKLALLGYTGSLNDILLQYYQDGGATSNVLNEAEMQWLAIQGATAYPLNNRRRQFYSSLGYTGSLNDMRYQYWWNL